MSTKPSAMGVVAIGHVLLDTIGIVETTPSILSLEVSRLCHIESKQMREIMSSLAGEQASSYKALSRTLGGSAAVTSMTTAILGLETSFLGCIGKDKEGEQLRKLFAHSGTRFPALASDRDTGIFLSIADSMGRHIMRVSPSAAIDIRKLKIEDAELLPGRILYLDGLLVDSGPWIIDIAKRARERGMMIAMDFSTPGNAKAHAQELRSFADSYCDLVFANAMEVQAVYGSEETMKLGNSLVLVEKRGAEGAILHRNRKKIRMAAQKVDVLDTTCAGDILAAGFIKALSEGRDDEECLAVGISAASIAIQYPGSGFDRQLMKDCVFGALAHN